MSKMIFFAVFRISPKIASAKSGLQAMRHVRLVFRRVHGTGLQPVLHPVPLLHTAVGDRGGLQLYLGRNIQNLQVAQQ